MMALMVLLVPENPTGPGSGGAKKEWSSHCQEYWHKV